MEIAILWSIYGQVDNIQTIMISIESRISISITNIIN